jgi:hypothetical protein
MPRIGLFATRGDYEQLAATQELFANLYFVADGTFPDRRVPVLRGLAAIPDLAVIKKKYDHAGPMYWVLRDKPKVGLRRLPDFEGEKRFVIDGNSLEQWVQFKPSGLFGDKVLIWGHLETTHPRGDTVPLFREMVRGFASVFTKFIYYGETTWVGPEALALQKQRYRLCLAVHRARNEDFKPAKAAKQEPAAAPANQRRTLAQTWRHLEARCEKMPRTRQGKPHVPRRKPGGQDDDPSGFSFFRTIIEEADYSACTLPRTFFGRSGLTEVSFRNTDLSGSWMCWNDFTGCDFTRADLSGCDLRASTFEGCKFDGATLKGADLRRSSFAGSSFNRADLTGAVLDSGSAAEWHADEHLSKAQRAGLVWTDPGERPAHG